MGKLVIYAPNIHQGGGKTLLKALLKEGSFKSEVLVFCDTRIEFSENSPKILTVKPSLISRAIAEFKLYQCVNKDDLTLCFGNLPPLLRLPCRTLVFLQNRYLIEYIPLDGFPFWSKLRITIERIWLNKKKKNADEFIVQTPTMKRLLDTFVNNVIPVYVAPFVPHFDLAYYSTSSQNEFKKKTYDFVYVSSGEPHKNHLALVNAWCLLAKDGIFPKLGITLKKIQFQDLCKTIEQISQQYDLKIINLDELDHDEILALYNDTNALIYPSSFESFGLPLIEANQAGVPILAPELDYVRDIITPIETFDPNSPVSIARAVKRFIGAQEPILELSNADSFLKLLLNK